MTIAILAEKPSVARDIAKVVGARSRKEGFLYGSGYVVTWAIGHLVTLAQPHEIDDRWRAWRRDRLPMLPATWPLVISQRTRDQFAIVRKILTSPKVSEVICATDAGREGELIFRYIYEASASTKPVRRLWISSLTPAAIRRGMEKLKPGSDLEPLADAARGRSRADWLVGLNFSRAVTLAHGRRSDETLSVGRVQTPTLAMVVERELEIRAFVPEDYLEIAAIFGPTLGPTDGPKGAPTDAPPEAATSDYASATKPSGTTKPASLPADQYRGIWFRNQEPADSSQPPTAGKPKDTQARRLDPASDEATAIIERVRTGKASIESVQSERKKWPAPLLYDLTELQRHANRLWGWSAKKTLTVAQGLYERKKVISYPRTDSRHISPEEEKTLPQIVDAIAEPYSEHLAEGTGQKPLGRRYVDASKVGDHHAILPTTVDASRAGLDRDEQRLYDLICRRLLATWHDDHVGSVTHVITAVEGETENQIDRFHSKGSMVIEQGWKVLDLGHGSAKNQRKQREEALPDGLEEGLERRVEDVRSLQKQTRPPKRFTEATLLTAMETAGKTLDDKELSEAMRETGLGTPATRAEIIETLFRRQYLERQGKSLAATDRGIRLIDIVHPKVKSPELTGRWEAELTRIQQNKASLPEFISGIERFVSEVVAGMFDSTDGATDGSMNGATAAAPSRHSGSTAPASPFDQAAPPPADLADSPSVGGPPEEWPMAYEDEADAAAQASDPWLYAIPQDGSEAAPPLSEPARHLRSLTSPNDRGSDPFESAPAQIEPAIHRTPTPPDRLVDLLRKEFSLESFRPFQEEACRTTTEGKDLLLVMPTGAGKSLCYQLPGLARAGTTLVVSPLIALMEDQVAKLKALGLRAERIHSGRGRAASRQTCSAYLAGHLDFLFIAPERLGVPGFPEMLAKRKPTLIAIDEAHCISQWGHDFRPDYRLLGERLPLLRPAPIIALTATATPRVQVDIVEQLGAPDARRSIHGFRRTNIAVEAVEMRPSARRETVGRILSDAASRPAIIYAPTRKEADALGQELFGRFPVKAYHAGMAAASRERVQAEFLNGDLEVIVATIAFGMGIDKADVRTVIHTGMPGSLEGYYQEIGRAGRDGKPSRAVLLYSWADRRTHEFFFGRDYPEASVLAQIHQALEPSPLPRGAIETRLSLDEDVFQKALEKLWIHGGVEIDPEENLALGQADWRSPYVAQRRHKMAQLEEITRFAQSRECRMLHLVQHFGDLEDAGVPCNLCDICLPDGCAVQSFEPPTSAEAEVLRKTLNTLEQRDDQTTGQLFRAVGEAKGLDRKDFERLLAGLARADCLQIWQDSFQKSGRTIHFQRASLGPNADRARTGDLRTLIKLNQEIAAPKRKSRKKSSTKRRGSTTATSKRRASSKGGNSDSSASPKLVAALKEWRLGEARKRRIPAFRILTNRTLEALASDAPSNEVELLQVYGVGPTLVRKYGDSWLRIIAQASS